MQGIKRRLVYIGLYELIAIFFTALLLEYMANTATERALGIAVAASVVAILWNLIFNYGFESWETRNKRKGRSLSMRLVHACGFEGGLLVLLIPLLAWWLEVSWWQALVMDLGLLVFFLGYTFAFNWLFDAVFGLPAALQQTTPKP